VCALIKKCFCVVPVTIDDMYSDIKVIIRLEFASKVFEANHGFTLWPKQRPLRVRLYLHRT